MSDAQAPESGLDEVERARLLAWARLGMAEKIGFFEEMIEIAHRSGALSPGRLALREARPFASARPPGVR